MKGGNFFLTALYAVLLAVGCVYALAVLIFGDGFASDVWPVLHPTVIIAALAAFGGFGLFLQRMTSWREPTVAGVSLCGALTVSALAFFLYVRPMRNAERSIAYSRTELAGRPARVSVAIPPSGYGEVIIKVGAGMTNEIAVSLDGSPIASGEKVVVVDVRPDALVVATWEDGPASGRAEETE